jgi:hypothetical protein
MLLAFPIALGALYLFAEPLELAASSIIQRHMHFSRSNKMAFECINPYSHRGKTFADCSTVEIKRLHLLWMDTLMRALIMARAFAATMEWMLKNRMSP